MRHGTVTLLGMIYYYSPTLGFAALGWRLEEPARWGAWVGAGVCFAAATVAIPGFM